MSVHGQHQQCSIDRKCYPESRLLERLVQEWIHFVATIAAIGRRYGQSRLDGLHPCLIEARSKERIRR